MNITSPVQCRDGARLIRLFERSATLVEASGLTPSLAAALDLVGASSGGEECLLHHIVHMRIGHSQPHREPPECIEMSMEPGPQARLPSRRIDRRRVASEVSGEGDTGVVPSKSSAAGSGFSGTSMGSSTNVATPARVDPQNTTPSPPAPLQPATGASNTSISGEK